MMLFFINYYITAVMKLVLPGKYCLITLFYFSSFFFPEFHGICREALNFFHGFHIPSLRSCRSSTPSHPDMFLTPSPMFTHYVLSTTYKHPFLFLHGVQCPIYLLLYYVQFITYIMYNLDRPLRFCKILIINP